VHAADHLVLGARSPSLTRFGLSVDADLVYRCLLTVGPRVAGRLERDLGLSPLRVAEGLDELRSVGAVTTRSRAGGAMILWTATRPEDLVPALRQNRPRPATVPVDLPGAVSLGDGIRHLPSRALTRMRLAHLVDAVRHEHLAMQPEQEYDAESARSALPMDQALLRRGVRMRVLGVQPVDDDPLAIHGRQAHDARPAYRHAAEVPTKLMVMDRRTAIVPVTPDNLEHGYLEITHRAVVAALVTLFERQWDAAEPRPARGTAHLLLSAREQQLLSLLAQRHTDQTAAAAMRISRRTVTNTLRSLMDRVGVQNRFQLGLAIGALGVVHPPPDGPDAAMPFPAAGGGP
jgi:DNA-binding CsgD family transcriptional regulator